MHSYSIDNKDLFNSYLYTIFPAILFSFLINELLSCWEAYQNLSWLFELPVGFIAVYTTLWSVVDKYLWKSFRRWGLFSTVDLSGSYDGYLNSNSEFATNPLPVTLEISQTLSRISVCLKTQNTTSFSESAVVKHKGPAIELVYVYTNLGTSTLFRHEGLTRLVCDPINEKLSGHYFSSPERNSSGDICVTKKGG